MKFQLIIEATVPENHFGDVDDLDARAAELTESLAATGAIDVAVTINAGERSFAYVANQTTKEAA